VASDVDRLEWTGRKLRARRPVYSGKAFATVEVSSAPAIATTRRTRSRPRRRVKGRRRWCRSRCRRATIRFKLIETKTPEAEELTIAEADIIVSGGAD